jgi:hypothetical protein
MGRGLLTPASMPGLPVGHVPGQRASSHQAEAGWGPGVGMPGAVVGETPSPTLLPHSPCTLGGSSAGFEVTLLIKPIN